MVYNPLDKGKRCLVERIIEMCIRDSIVTPTNQYLYASGANELTLVENCVISVGAAGVFKTENTVLNAANLDVGSAFTVGCDYYVYICDSRVDAQDEQLSLIHIYKEYLGV